MRIPKLEIGTILAFLPFVLGGTVFSGMKLSRVYIPFDSFSATAIFLSIIVLVLAALSFTLILTLIAQTIKLIGDFNVGFWSSTATLLQEVSVWLILYWILLWGVPFTFAMSVYFSTSQYFNQYFAGTSGLIASVFSLILIRFILPRDIWKAAAKFNPDRSLGWKKALLLTLTLIAVGSFYMHSCYIFDVKLSSTEFKTTDQIEVRAKISGRITNQNSLRAIMVPITSVDVETEPQSFNSESNGNYVTWIDLNRLTPGKYRIIIFFNDYSTKSIYKKLKLLFWHHNLKKTFIVRIE